STVGTLSELYDLLRLLFARLGKGEHGVVEPPRRRSLFSFNSPEGWCPACHGLGVEDRLDPELLVADATRSIRDRALAVTTPNGYLMYSQVTLAVLDSVCRAHGFSIDVPWRELTDEQRKVVLYGSDAVRVAYGKHPLESRLKWTGITPRPRQEGVYKGIVPVMEGILQRERNPSILRFCRTGSCRACNGRRLRPEALAVRLHGRSIAELAGLEVAELVDWLEGLVWEAGEVEVGEPVRHELLGRAALLGELGLGYLTLDRPSPTLSGGEAQRLRLSSLAAVGLRGLLVVLDEPTVGLHPRDVGRLIAFLRRLRDGGNTVIVVEHDPMVWATADWIVELGPGAGPAGGEVVWSGPAADWDIGSGVRGPVSVGEGESRVSALDSRPGGGRWLHAAGLTSNNLRGIEVSLAVGGLNIVTGVSGAGKSSLAEELVERLAQGRLSGDAVPVRALVVDQAPIGRTPRSNPATYIGAFDLIRDLFARQPAARERGLERRHFSFNVPGGRCEACEGAGVEEVGMHFLGSVELPCEACGGTRFGPETLGVTWRGRSIADVLAMPVSEAVGFFADQPRLARMLAALEELGLGYVTLGQPSPTLSGGEAQRVKLASELVRGDSRSTLFVLDEPTMGLHPADVQVLLAALRRLTEAGHTVLVVEHDLDVVRAADHVIDLGPEGGASGGSVLAAGAPEVIGACERSYTGFALRALAAGQLWSRSAGQATATAHEAWRAPIELRGVRTHNLAGIDVSIPAGRLTVMTGVSGSGKSSLAFDTLHGEARRRYLECLPTVVRTALGQVGEADLDSASGLFASLGVRQQRASRNPRSTVGTLTGASELLRLLFARAGTRHCPECGSVLAGHVCAACGFQGIHPLWAWHFSPSNQHTACPTCHGLGFGRRCEPKRLISHPDRPLGAGAMDGTRIGRFFGEPDGQHVAALLAVGREMGIDFSVAWADLGPQAREIAMRGAGERTLEVEWRFKRGKREGVHRFTGRWAGFCGLVEAEYARVHADARGEALESLLAEEPCPTCHGGGLQPELLAVRFAGRSIAEAAALPARAARTWLDDVETAPEQLGVTPREVAISAGPRAQLALRLQQLESVGLGYLSPDRRAATLSGGEAQRVRLAALPGCGLVGLLAVLDEPTTGLHPRDTAELVKLIDSLRDRGNTVVVVEHDPAVIGAADHVIELGPGAGADGGRIIATGQPAELAANPASVIGPYLTARHVVARTRRTLRPGVRMRGAQANNLRGLDVEIPAGGLVAVTGVSGSGKSTLVFD
ncbi:MAG TPA: ATP-binding cassette domain-containing protein, partial [Thermoanaerobaculaceae bacterium]|nr:ATP-binding cassette domain-containing protein [Thermoanaerobaculaceae bacterium]